MKEPEYHYYKADKLNPVTLQYTLETFDIVFKDELIAQCETEEDAKHVCAALNYYEVIAVKQNGGED